MRQYFREFFALIIVRMDFNTFQIMVGHALKEETSAIFQAAFFVAFLCGGKLAPPLPSKLLTFNTPFTLVSVCLLIPAFFIDVVKKQLKLALCKA